MSIRVPTSQLSYPLLWTVYCARDQYSLLCDKWRHLRFFGTRLPTIYLRWIVKNSFASAEKKEKTRVHTRKGKTLSLSRPQFSSSSGAINIRARTSFCLFVVFLGGKRPGNQPVMFFRVKNIQPFRCRKNIHLYIYNSDEIARNANEHIRRANSSRKRNWIIILCVCWNIQSAVWIYFRKLYRNDSFSSSEWTYYIYNHDISIWLHCSEMEDSSASARSNCIILKKKPFSFG